MNELQRECYLGMVQESLKLVLEANSKNPSFELSKASNKLAELGYQLVGGN